MTAAKRMSQLLPLLVAVLLAGPAFAAGKGAAKKKAAPAPAARAAHEEPKAVKGTATSTPERSSAPTEASTVPRGPTRIDFDDRMIQGQTNKSGAVYLFDRKELTARSMVSRRTTFRDQIVKDVLAE